MPAIPNPVDDKVRGARKRYGARAALWGLLTTLYAAGRDAEAQQLRQELRRRPAEEVLLNALALPELMRGRLGEALIPWVAHRYHLAERSGDERVLRHLDEVLPRAAYPLMAWQERARPRPNLFDLSVDEAYAAAQSFLGGKTKRPPKQGRVVFRFDDGWTVQNLNTTPLLVDEGNHQSICVGQVAHGYPERMENGEIKIYSLRDPEGMPHATMTWDVEEGKLTEASGELNEELEVEQMKRCAAFGRHMGMSDVDLFLAKILSAREANLSGADLSGADLLDANLGEANLNRAYLIGANLSGANLYRAKLGGANLYRAILRGAYLSGANLYRAKLGGANLYRAILRGANLSEANLSEANLNSANLIGANLSFADLIGAKLKFADLRDANLNSANLSRANLIDADLSEANLSEANLNSANLIGANLSFADLRDADLNSANLSRANLIDADLIGAYLGSAWYDGGTTWPLGFDPIAAGATFIRE